MGRELRRHGWKALAIVSALLGTTALAEGPGRELQPFEPSPAERALLTGGDTISASDALDELLIELAADLKAQGSLLTSPVLLERVHVSSDFDPSYAAVLEARILAALKRARVGEVLRCLECTATQGRVEAGAWVVRRGLTRKADLDLVGKRYGATTLLAVALTRTRGPDGLALDAQLTRAADAAIVFAEGYRFDVRRALIYRGSDDVRRREAQLEDIADRLANRPHFGHGVYLGAMIMGSDSPEGPVTGFTGSYRLYEKFGARRQFRVGLTAGGFLHSSRLAGALLGVVVLGRLTEESLYWPEVYFGGEAGGFITGGAGNTPMGGLQIEVLFGRRFALHAGALWIHPFDLAKRGEMIGTVCPRAGLGVVW